jgi:hypothetical protein
MRRRVVHHLREDHGTRRRERPPCPPQVQRARMPMADRLLACAGLVDGIQRQGNLQAMSHGVSNGKEARQNFIIVVDASIKEAPLSLGKPDHFKYVMALAKHHRIRKPLAFPQRQKRRFFAT